MPNPPDTPSLAIPARSERLRVGECTVDIPLREIRAPSARRLRRVTPKAIGVLLVLVEHADKVVSRDALLARVWPDTLPTDDVLTQAVTQLRKALGEERGQPRYIETIAKSGYRLRAPVQWLDDDSGPVEAADAASYAVDTDTAEFPALPQLESAASNPGARGAGAKASPDRPRAPLRELLTAGVVAVVLALGLSAFLLLRAGAPADESAQGEGWSAGAGTGRPYRLLTSAPGFELAPTLSPEASMVAYSASLPDRRGTVILVQTTDQSQPRQLSHPADGVSDRVPAWSPDGREIAFVRAGPGLRCQILVVPASGGAERRIGACDPRSRASFSWAPDGRSLIFGSMTTGAGRAGLRVLDLASGQWHTVDYDAATGDLDHAPRYSPDGRWIVFVRNPQFGDLWRIPASGGRAERLTRQSGEMRGWDWLPDGRGLVFGRRIGLQTRLYQLDLDTRQVRDLGIDDAQSPTVAARSGMMAFVRRRPQFGIFRIPRGPAEASAAPVHLFASSARDSQPRVAPDARQLVFTSDRSGDFGLWWADLQQPGSLRMIEGLQPGTRGLPQWSSDSRSLLVAGTDRAGRTGIHEIVPASGQVSLLPVPVEQPLQADYLPGPQRILVTEQLDDGRMRVTLFDRSTRPWRALAWLDDVSLPKVDPANDRVLFTRLSADGLWKADLALSPGSVRQVSQDAPARWRYQSWAVAEDGSVDYLDSLRGCLAMLRPIAGTAATADTSKCLHPDRLASTTGFSVSAQADAVFVALAIADGTDVAFMPVPAPTEPTRGAIVPGWLK
ncbi:MAG: winged helix-turn-helix domain-containing protein [Proteobacteria bacterium]|nr:winged helix-turn-helix domain-containing protein [Pseudomonadota bacterium]